MGRYRSVVVGILLGIYTFIRFRAALKGFWLFDDPYLLHMAAENNPLYFFVKPSVWQLMNMRSFTPMLMLSFWTDYTLFGFHVQYFYAHQLVVLWLSSVMLYLLLIRYVDWRFSLVGALLFLSSAPVGAAANMLMVRHYVEGLFFCLVAVYCFIEAAERKSAALSLLGAGSFFFAIAAKEISVPAGLLIVFLPVTDFRNRLRYSIPFLAVLMVYFVWRGAMLGSVAGAQQTSIPVSPAGILGLLGRMPRDIMASISMFSGGHGFALAVACCFGILVFFAGASIVASGSYGAIGVLVVLMLSVYSVPMLADDLYLLRGDFPSYRLVYSVSAFLAVSATLAVGRFYSRKAPKRGRSSPVQLLALGAFALIFVFTAIGSYRWLNMQKKVLLYPLSAQGKFFFESNGDVMLVNSFPVYEPAGYFEHLEYLKTGRPSALVAAGMFAFLDKEQSHALKQEKVFAFDNESGRIKDITAAYQRGRAAFLARVKDLPLSVSFQVRNGVISYAFGPVEGRFIGLLGYRPSVYASSLDLPPTLNSPGATERKRFYFRVARETPGGLLTFSPEWLVDVSKDTKIQWERK